MAPNLTLTPDLQAAEGNLAPAPAVQPIAVATPAAAPAPVAAGQAALGSTDADAADAALQMRLTQPAPNSFGAKLGAALDKPENAIPLTAAGKPVPGGWARSLVGAAQGVLANFGDIPDTKAPVGAGFISGISGTIRNHN